MNLNTLGYTSKLFILPFDHRSSFAVKYLNLPNAENLSRDQVSLIKECRRIVYEGFKNAVSSIIPKNEASFLTDEEFGGEILTEAVRDGFVVCQTTEKSGQKEFQFEYGEEFGVHINKIKPAFAKALLIYNPEGDKELNKRQRHSIKRLAEFCHLNGYKLLVEPLVHATESQLIGFSGDRSRYDKEMRPELTVKMMEEFHQENVEVDVWKIEGMYTKEAYQLVADKATEDGRSDVGIVILGRAESDALVEGWLKAGSAIKNVLGFAIGRTIFYEPLFAYRDKKISKEEAISKISEKYIHFYNVFKGI